MTAESADDVEPDEERARLSFEGQAAFKGYTSQRPRKRD